MSTFHSILLILSGYLSGHFIQKRNYAWAGWAIAMAASNAISMTGHVL